MVINVVNLMVGGGMFAAFGGFLFWFNVASLSGTDLDKKFSLASFVSFHAIATIFWVGGIVSFLTGLGVFVYRHVTFQ